MPPKQPIKQTNEILLDGTLEVGVAAVALPGSTREINSVLVQADPDNQSSIFVGNETSQSVQLAGGGVEIIDVNNPSKIYVRAAAGTQRVNWHAVGGS